ncbi:unnamed protein product, partial [Ectocarpus fasciculatus]
IAAAGVGAAHVLTGPGRLEGSAWEEASSACPGMRYYGGARFEPLSRTGHSSGGAVAAAARGADGSSDGSVSKAGDVGEPSPCWRAYGGHWLVLPQVELSSVPAAQAGGGRPAAVLAVNLRWTDALRSTTPAVASAGNGTAVRKGKGDVGGQRRADVEEESTAAGGSCASDADASAPPPSEALSTSTATAAPTGHVTAAISAVGGYGCERDRQRSGGSGAVVAPA